MVEPVSRAIEGQPQPFRAVQPLGKRISDALAAAAGVYVTFSHWDGTINSSESCLLRVAGLY
jgi:hypothetical protein